MMKKKLSAAVVFSGLLLIVLMGNQAAAQELGLIPMDPEKYVGYLKKEDLWRSSTPEPAYWDWRDFGMVTPAKDQGHCGSCWAFAATGVFESKILIKDGLEYDLSEQMLISSSGAPSAFGCCGGKTDAIRFYETVSPREESSYPYGDWDFSLIHDTCPPASMMAEHYTSPPVCYNVSDFYSVDINNLSAAKRSIRTDGPGILAYWVYEDFRTYWASPSGTAPWLDGVYFHQSGEFLGGHAVMLIGWDDETQSALCKNSWGTADDGRLQGGPFGDGTFRIRYDQRIEEIVNFTIVDGDCDGYTVALQNMCVRQEINDLDYGDQETTLSFLSTIDSPYPERIDGGYLHWQYEYSSGNHGKRFISIPNDEFCIWDKNRKTFSTRIGFGWYDNLWMDMEYWIVDIEGVESEHYYIRIYPSDRQYQLSVPEKTTQF
jgi:Papain family cysteine protease